MSFNPNAELFKPESLSLSDIFTNGDPLYQIPDYQRPYSWVDEQIEQLWGDIYEAYQNNIEDEEIDANYFLGSLIIVKKDIVEEVVDGQQRLTTLMILLCVLRQMYPKINKEVNPMHNPSVIKIGKIRSYIADANDLNRLRLQSDPSQASNVESLVFDSEIDFSTYVKPSKKDIATDPKHRYINTSVIFYEHLKEIGENDAGSFINYLMNKVKLIKITCFDESFAIKLFQVLNDRGMDLSSADIIKGYLLSSINGKENKHKHDTFMHDWRLCEEWVKELDESLTDLFTYYEYYLLARNPKKSLVDELKDKFKGEDSNVILRNFKKFVECYKDIVESPDKLINSCWYLPWSTYWITMFIAIDHKSYEDSEELKKVIHRFFYLNFMAGRSLNSLKQTFLNLISSIKKKEPIEAIKETLEEKLLGDNVVKTVLKKLQGEVYYEGWLKPILALIEYYCTDEDEVAFISLDAKNVNVEHIYPQNPEKDSEWFKMFPNATQYLNTLGNLTFLNGAKNRYAQNFIFSQKINIYQGLDKNGQKTISKQGKLTVYQISHKIVNDYASGIYKKKWNEKAVKDRFNWLVEQIGSVLDIDVSSVLYNRTK